jgi:hypothetical protein
VSSENGFYPMKPASEGTIAFLQAQARASSVTRRCVGLSNAACYGKTVKKSLRSCSLAALRRSGPTPKISSTVRNVELWS